MIERLPRLLAGLLAAAAVAAWQPACAKQDELVVGINAGVSAGEGLDELRQRFRRLGEAFSQATRQKVRIEPLYSSLVEKQLARDSYPLFIVHTHHALQAEKAGKYQVVALAQAVKDDRIAFIADGKSPVKTLADLKGRNLVMPAEFSFLSVAARAVLRQQKEDIGALQVKYMRSQEAVTWVIENGLGEVGVTRSASYVAKWREGGGKVVFESEQLPVYAVVASRKLPAGMIDQMRSALSALGDSETGKAALADIGVKGFSPAEPASSKRLAEWFGTL